MTNYQHLEDYRRPDGKFGSAPATESDEAILARADSLSTKEAVAPIAMKAQRLTGIAEIGQFRASAALTAEFDDDQGGFVKMDPTTRRGNYQTSDGGTFTMPNRTAVLREVKRHGRKATIEIPVRDSTGTMSWYRLTPNKTGRGFEVTPTVKSPEATLRAEQLRAVMESRRVKSSLIGAEDADLLAARKARFEARGASLNPTTSSWIDSTGYSRSSELMVMRTKDYHRKDGGVTPGRTYGLANMSSATYAAFAQADAPGKFFNEHIKGRYDRVQVSVCTHCGDVHAISDGAKPPCKESPLTTERARTPEVLSQRTQARSWLRDGLSRVRGRGRR